MKTTTLGLFVGLILGLALAFGGFGHMLIVAFIGLIGYLVAKVVAGDLDVSKYLSGRNGR